MRIILTLGVMLWASAAFAQTTNLHQREPGAEHHSDQLHGWAIRHGYERDSRSNHAASGIGGCSSHCH
jgi:hypothetical protein